MSTVEVEFLGMAHGSCELLWIRSVLKELGIKYKISISLHYDNKLGIEIAHNSIQYDKTKHIEVDSHFIKENFDQKII